MKTVTGIVVVAVGLSLACAQKKTSAAPAPAVAAAAPAAARSAGAQAAAKLTAEDLTARMKTIMTVGGGINAKITNNQLADAAKDAQALAAAFGDVERFFAQANKQDAVQWSQQARTGASDAAGALTAGDAAKANAALGNMRATCKQCHTVYREGDMQTGFRIKAGSL